MYCSFINLKEITSYTPHNVFCSPGIRAFYLLPFNSSLNEDNKKKKSDTKLTFTKNTVSVLNSCPLALL